MFGGPWGQTMIAPRTRAKAARPSLTMRILRGSVFTGICLTIYFLYTRRWTVDETTTKLLILFNVAIFTPYFYYIPIESVRNGSSTLQILIQVISSYGYTAVLFGLFYTFTSDYCQTQGTSFDLHWIVCGKEGTPFNQVLKGIDGIYFSFTTLATVGFGDIYLAHTFARFLVTLEIFVGIIYTLVMFAIVSNVVTRRLDGPRDRS